MKKPNIEKISAEVHNAWWREKEKQGFHPPLKCPNPLERPVKGWDAYKFKKHCRKCHTDMYPYEELPENIKKYDRVTVRTVLNAIDKIKSTQKANG